MAKYNYSRKGLKGLTPFPFLGEVKTRLAAIEAAPDTMPQSIYNANILAAKLHPAVQHVQIAEVVDHGGAKSFTRSRRGEGHGGDGVFPRQPVCLRGAEHRRRGRQQALHHPLRPEGRPRQRGYQLHPHNQAD